MVKFTFRLLKASFVLVLALLGIAWTVFRAVLSLASHSNDRDWMTSDEAEGWGEPAGATISQDGKFII